MRSTDCPSGPAEILGGGEFGELVPVGDVAAMSGAILRALNEPPAPERLVERARAFSDEVAADRFLTLIGD